MTIVSRSELHELLKHIPPNTQASVKISTEPKMRKTNNPYFNNVKKITTMNVVLNFNYETAVNQQRELEGNPRHFKALPRIWGERIPSTCFVEYKGKTYLEMQVIGSTETQFINKTTNEKIEDTVIGPFLIPPNSNMNHQGVRKEIVLRDVLLENVLEIYWDGEHHFVK